MPGKAYPPEFFSSTVDIPSLGVWVAGDLTENGYLSEWQNFVGYYGLHGGDGTADPHLDFPVYEGYGNHDINGGREWVKDGITERHGTLHYSKDADNLHVCNVNMCPANTFAAEFALLWLEDDLATNVGDSGKAVIIIQHYAFDGDNEQWWTIKQKDAFKDAIEGYNVIGIFHGHWHNTFHYYWEEYDVYNVGATKASPEDNQGFTVVHVTDTLMEAANWHYVWGDTTGDQGSWKVWQHAKDISVIKPTILQHPKSRTVFEGEPAGMMVTAAGPGVLSYQWYADGVSPIPGAVKKRIYTPSADRKYSGVSLTCVVSNLAGSVTSEPAILTVLAKPRAIPIQ